MKRRILAAITATTWLAGCVSILGVDPEDHDDLGDLVCACAEAPRAVCDAVLEKAVASGDDVEQRLLECAAKDRTCAALDTCIGQFVVGQENDRCSVNEKPKRVILRCDDGLECSDQGRCVPSTACVDVSESCAGGGRCCSGRACAPDGTCPPCGSPSDPCGEGMGCCDAEQPLVCSVATNQCAQCAGSLEGCTDDLPCCDTGRCPATRRCL